MLARSIDHMETAFVNLLARCLLIAAWSTVGTSLVIAGSPEEDFRAGLSAFNGGDFAAAMRLWRPLADNNDARDQTGIQTNY
jgi:hypothetical protein